MTDTGQTMVNGSLKQTNKQTNAHNLVEKQWDKENSTS